MIKLKKAKQPDILAKHAQQWRDEYLLALSTGAQVKFHYNDSDIKQRLVEETNGKCAYCESLIRHVCPGDIEHILPKNPSARPELCYDWDNLTLACEVCNRTQKKDYYDPNLLLLNPYSDDPDAYLFCLGALIFAKSDRRAKKTWEILDFNRAPLLEMRKEKLKQIDRLLRVWLSPRIPKSVKNRVACDISEMVSEKKEYLFVAKEYLREKGFPVG